MSDLTVTIGGTLLSGVGPHSPPTMTFTHRGPGQLSWAMDTAAHPRMVGLEGARVTASAGGGPLWVGNLSEVAAAGEYHAMGAPVLADSTPAIDGAGLPANGESFVVAAALARGALDGWKPLRFDFGVWPGGDSYIGMSVAELLDAITEANGQMWRLDGHGEAHLYNAAPSVPKWHVTIPGYRYGYSIAGLATHLLVHFMVDQTPPVAATLEVATGLGGFRREAWIDVTDRGPLTFEQARGIGRSVAVGQGRETPAPTERVDVPRGALRTPGGTAVPGWMLQAGDTVRVWGASDSRSAVDYLDVVAGGGEYNDATGGLVFDPAGLVPRGYEVAVQSALTPKRRVFSAQMGSA